MPVTLPPLGSQARPYRLELELTRDHPLTPYAYFHTRARPVEFDVHLGYEVGIVLGGEEVRTFPDGTSLRVRPGQVWLHPMWELHGHRIVHANTQVVVLMFLPELLGEQLLGNLPWLTLFSAPPSQRAWVNDQRTRARVLELGRRLWKEIREEPIGWQTAVYLGLVQLLLEVRRGWAEAEGAGAYVRDLSLVLPAISALHADPGRKLTLAEAAAVAKVSPPYFSRLFRRSTGLSFHRFLLRTRTAQAAQRLLSSRASIEDAASEFGFVDGSHLHRHFLRQFGCTPAEYRRRYRE